MIHPIVVYGDPILRKKAETIQPATRELQQLIADMFDTMAHAKGIGLAAPQIGKSLRLIVVDTHPALEQLRKESNSGPSRLFDNESGIRRVIINPELLHKGGDSWIYEEGCLSIPSIREEVLRPDQITLRYLNEHLQPVEETFTGLAGRVVQHEFDHVEGILFIDYLKPLRKRLLKKSLERISRGEVPVDYPIRIPVLK